MVTSPYAYYYSVSPSTQGKVYVLANTTAPSLSLARSGRSVFSSVENDQIFGRKRLLPFFLFSWYQANDLSVSDCS